MWDFLTCSWWTTYGISSEISACLWLWETALILQISTWLLVRSECFIMSHTKMSSALGETDSLNTNKWIHSITVCGLNGTEYECKCEENHVWPNDTCRAYQVCDGIVGGTCGCIPSSPFRGSTLPERWEITLDHRCADCNCSNMTGMNLLGDSTRLETFDCNIYVIPSHSFFPDINECEDAVSVCGQYSDCINIMGVTCVHAGVDLIPPIKTVLWAATTHVRVSVIIFFIYIFILWTWVYRAALSLHFQYYC